VDLRSDEEIRAAMPAGGASAFAELLASASYPIREATDASSSEARGSLLLEAGGSRAIETPP
jgi:hypothetical protein